MGRYPVCRGCRAYDHPVHLANTRPVKDRSEPPHDCGCQAVVGYADGYRYEGSARASSEGAGAKPMSFGPLVDETSNAAIPTMIRSFAKC